MKRTYLILLVLLLVSTMVFAACKKEIITTPNTTTTSEETTTSGNITYNGNNKAQADHTETTAGDSLGYGAAVGDAGIPTVNW